MRIFLDNAATTPLTPSVLEAMLPYLQANFGNPSATYAEGRTTRAAIERARKQLASHLKASPSEIIFTSGGTEANNMAIKCAVRDLGIERIISSPIEHACVLNAVQQVTQQYGLELVYVPLEPSGRASLSALAQILAQSPKKTLVSLMHANNELGTLNDIEAIGELCQQHGAYFHSDTVQTIGHLPINLQKIKAHFISGSAHKLHGPKGTGFLYIQKQVPIRAFIDGGGQERQMRSGTENVAGIIGFCTALDQALSHLNEHRAHIEACRQAMMQGLKAGLGERVGFNGDYQGQYLYTVLSAHFETKLPLNMLLFHLDLKGLSVSGGSACSSGANKGSHVLNTLGLSHLGPTVRFSFSQLTTLAEVEQAVAIVVEVLNKNP